MIRKKLVRIVFAIGITTFFLLSSIAEISMPIRAQYTNQRGFGSIPLPSGVTPDLTYETIAHMSFRPNPIGLGQPLLINLWMQPPINVGHLITGLTVTFTKPDRTTETIGPISTYQGDGTAWFEYTPDQLGNWTIKFDLPGAYFPAGNYTIPADNEYNSGSNLNAQQSVYYKPSSDGPYTFAVQEEPASHWIGSSLPTDYWTRPVSPENREWWPILGNFPATGVVAGVGRGVTLADWPANTNTYMSNYGYISYVQGPKTAHIAWKRQGEFGGLAGGTMGITSIQNSAQYPSYVNGPSIIFMGRCYQSVTKVFDGITQPVWQCYDLRTGAVYWEKTNVTQVPNMIVYSERELNIVQGESASTLGMRIDLMYVGGGRLILYNPFNGLVKANVSISPLTTGTYYASYDWPYFLSVQSLGGQYRLINWTIQGTSIASGQFGLTNFVLQVCNNITWPFSSLGVVDYEAGIAVGTSGISTPSVGVTYGQRIMGASIITGQLLWNVTTDTTKGLGGFFSGSTAVADHGKYAVRLNDGHWHCWDLQTGKDLWVSELSSWPWGTFGCYNVISYGGNIISNQYDGVAAYDWDTGKIAWRYKYNPEYAYESVYGDDNTGEEYYPFYTSPGSSGTQPYVADGVYYCYNDEHSISEPIPRGYKLHAINATTGAPIWNITGRMSPWGIADGYLVGADMYDGYMYVFGKGTTTTTVTAPDIIVAKGTGVMIKGTVLDNSLAQPGTPCVSKDSMSTQMQYLHMQTPIDSQDHQATITGVPVSIDAVDPNGNYIHIGDTTTNGYGGDFGFAWTPQTEGKYSITASFAGDDSYGSSMATTTMSVSAATATAAPTSNTVQAAPDYNMTIIAMGILIMIVVSIFGVLSLRKRS
jgi:hypothetical protein